MVIKTIYIDMDTIQVCQADNALEKIYFGQFSTNITSNGEDSTLNFSADTLDELQTKIQDFYGVKICII